MAEETYIDRVKCLKAELRSYGNDIQTHLKALYDPNFALSTSLNGGKALSIDLTINPLNTIPMLHNDVIDLLKESKEIKAVNSSNNKEELERMKEDLLQCEEMILILKQVAEVVGLLETISFTMYSSDIMKACDHLTLLEVKLKDLKGLKTELERGFVVSLLKKEASLLKFQFIARLLRLIRFSVQIFHGRISVTKSLKGVVNGEENIIETPILLSDLWSALLHMQQAENFMPELVDSLWTCVLLPIWREKKLTAPKVAREEIHSSLLFEVLQSSTQRQQLANGLQIRL